MEYGIVATIKTNNNSLSGQKVDHQGEDSSYVIPDYFRMFGYQNKSIYSNFKTSW